MNVLWVDEITETVDELKAMLHHQTKAQLRERI